MSQYIRPAQAFGAESSPIASPASPEATNHRNLHQRIVAKLGYRQGTTQWGTLKSLNSTERDLQIADADYTAMVAAGVDFSDALYNSSTARGAYIATSEVPTLWNPGLHLQIIDCIGDSITNSAVGAGTFPLLNTLSNKLWAQGIAGHTLPGHYDSTAVSLAPDFAYTFRWAHPKSRMCRNFGRDSGRCVNIPTWTYTAGSPWTPNVQQMDKQLFHSSQQHVWQIFLGTNDIAYGSTNGNPGLAAVPVGTAGASSTGSPNYIVDSLTPLIAALKGIDPTSRILYVTPIARTADAVMNGKFNDIANYVVANRAALYIDQVLDTRTISQFDCRNAAVVTANSTYYQSDAIHLTPTANTTIWRPQLIAAYDTILALGQGSGIPSSGTVGQPIGLLLALTKAS